MGETTIRLASRTLRAWNGVSMGSGACAPGAGPAPARSAIQASYPCSHAASRSRRFSCEMRCERVSSE
ncbi:Uncharacterised protein [Bordetella pertussis]|nr:Uncharacterised protein [Bordetella pertussis]CFP47601.1 Uncharacterised protein [Bordetella pertussis]CPH75022.1 Uncharacterised protein [Bordetella pertussis]CPI41609.1 Uncharacterised protein [Bordetella pertussis]CPI46693.1 Uncharacterised protein [Bordetella pertussis]